MTHSTTTVRRLRLLALVQEMVAGKLRLAVLISLLGSVTALAQRPVVHPLHAGAMPPGAIGSQRLLRGGPLSGYTQPVEIRVPAGVEVGLPVDNGRFSTPEPGDPLVGLRVGQIYRLRVTNLFDRPGVELYPTVELIDRLHPPRGEELRFPVPIDLTAEDLELAASGRFVTRVIYVEDPSQALPVTQDEGRTAWQEVRRDEDPLEVADRAGRPIAILRLGGRDWSQTASAPISYQGPAMVEYDRQPIAE